ncbi:MAG: TlpA disulfide reductase family protein [Planctomycetaceae bacterium]
MCHRGQYDVVIAGLIAGLLFIPGCGDAQQDGTPSNEQAAAGNTESQPAERNSLPTASIGTPPATENVATQPAGPEKGSPEWILKQIKDLRISGTAAQGSQSATDKTDGALDQEQLENRRAARRDRNLNIIDLCTEAIKLTHDDADQEPVFNEAVQHLLQARLQLAYQGQAEDVDKLYADVESLRNRDPQSKAAAESLHALVMFASTNARRYGAQDGRWLNELGRQVRLFATQCPSDPRAEASLFSAGISCDAFGVDTEATRCFSALLKLFPDGPRGLQARAILRRLQLPGRSLELGGPTIDGGFVDAEQLRGQALLVVFWSSDNPQFRQQLPLLQQTTRKYEKYLRTVGVCLDENEAALDAFLEQSELRWLQIFDPDNRRWDNNIVKYYGVRSIPAIWLVDSQGIVRDVSCDPSALDKQIRDLLVASQKPTNPAP